MFSLLIHCIEIAMDILKNELDVIIHLYEHVNVLAALGPRHSSFYD